MPIKSKFEWLYDELREELTAEGKTHYVPYCRFFAAMPTHQTAKNFANLSGLDVGYKRTQNGIVFVRLANSSIDQQGRLAS